MGQANTSLSLLGIAVDDLLVNRSGGAIILGHPRVMRDTRIIGTTALELVARGGKRALCIMCRDVDQGIGIVLEHA